MGDATQTPRGGGGSGWTHPTSGKDEALTLVASELCREHRLDELAERVEVRWNPRMRTAAGRAFTKIWRIELNPRLQSLPEGQRERELRSTFLHELAHLFATARSPGRRIAPHGDEWRAACADLGIPGEDRCHDLGFEPRRHAKKYAYTCPACDAVIERVRRLRRRVACYACCRKFAKGCFDARFQLVESRIG